MFIDAADLVIRRVVNILLVEIGHSGAGRPAEEDLRWTGGSKRWLPGQRVPCLWRWRLCAEGTSDIQRLVVAREIAKD